MAQLIFNFIKQTKIFNLNNYLINTSANTESKEKRKCKDVLKEQELQSQPTRLHPYKTTAMGNRVEPWAC